MELTDPRMDVARKNIRLAAALRDISISEVSRRAGMSRNGLGQFVSGRTSLSWYNMLQVCDILEIPIGIVHRPDAITEGRIRLYRMLERLPDHLAQKALEAAREIAGDT